MNWETAKDIMSCLTSLFFLIGVIWAASSFKHKLEPDIRDLYIENCGKISDFLSQIRTNTSLSCKTLDLLLCKLNEARFEAEICLPMEIFYLIDELYDKTLELHNINRRLEGLPKGESREKLTEEERQLKICLYEKLINLRNLYRKYIVQENFLTTIKNRFKRP